MDILGVFCYCMLFVYVSYDLLTVVVCNMHFCSIRGKKANIYKQLSPIAQFINDIQQIFDYCWLINIITKLQIRVLRLFYCGIKNIYKNNKMRQQIKIRKDLDLLEKNTNSQYRYFQPNPRIGFNQKRTLKYPLKLQSFSHNNGLLALTKAETEVTKQIRDIDNVLLNKHHSFRYRNGYLFRQGTSQQLIDNFAKLITAQCESLQFGFAVWRIHDDEGIVKLVGGKVGPTYSHFNSKITDKSIEKLEYYNEKKRQESINYEKDPWKHFSKVKQQRFKTESNEIEISNVRKSTLKKSKLTEKSISIYRKHTDFGNYNCSSLGINSSLLQPITNSKLMNSTIKQDLQYSFRSIKQLQNGLSFKEIVPSPSKQQLGKMILKQNKIISVWTPPSNYPQLLMVASLQIRQKQAGILTAWIAKYYFLRHALSKRLFSSLYQWLVLEYGNVVQICLTTTRAQFDSILCSYGWKVATWINDERVRIIYKNN